MRSYIQISLLAWLAQARPSEHVMAHTHAVPLFTAKPGSEIRGLDELTASLFERALGIQNSKQEAALPRVDLDHATLAKDNTALPRDHVPRAALTLDNTTNPRSVVTATLAWAATAAAPSIAIEAWPAH